MNLSRLSALGLTLSALIFAAPLPCSANVMLASPFTDHAVLQRDFPVPIWGRGIAGEKITVTFHDQTLTTAADVDGRWAVTLKAMPADASGAKLSVVGQNTIVLQDIVVGEVWLASGQSNMEWPLNLARDGQEEIARANLPLVRHLRIDHSPSDSPSENVKTGGWQQATPETAGSFSAVAFFFARALASKLGVPVGIIHSSWGGTPIESWIAEPVLRTTKAWPRFNAEWQEALKTFPEKMAAYPALDTAWRKADEASRASGKPNPLPWPLPPVGPGTAYAPGGLFNGMIVPLIPYAIRGALWYQGESNVGRAGEYTELFPALIHAWRKSWGGGDFPFLYVQLPNYADGNPAGRKWAELREAQNAALKLPAVSMAVTIDAGEANNLHPTNKRPVGERLAAAAEAEVYELPVEGSGPTFDSVQREGAAMRVRFTRAKNLFTKKTPVPGFEIAGADRIYHTADAVIEGESVVVSSADVAEPVAVRYGWTNSPDVSLYNGAELPAAPFRTDRW